MVLIYLDNISLHFSLFRHLISFVIFKIFRFYYFLCKTLNFITFLHPKFLILSTIYRCHLGICTFPSLHIELYDFSLFVFLILVLCYCETFWATILGFYQKIKKFKLVLPEKIKGNIINNIF